MECLLHPATQRCGCRENKACGLWTEMALVFIWWLSTTTQTHNTRQRGIGENLFPHSPPWPLNLSVCSQFPDPFAKAVQESTAHWDGQMREEKKESEINHVGKK